MKTKMATQKRNQSDQGDKITDWRRDEVKSEWNDGSRLIAEYDVDRLTKERYNNFNFYLYSKSLLQY